jgi:BRCA1-associated RING domain protein 1
MESFRRFLNPLVLNLQKMELELTCPVCLKLLNAPTMLPCYHTSCSKCATTRTMDGYSCAICKSAYRSQDLRPASHLEAIVNIHRSLSSTVSSMVTQQEAQADIPVAKTSFQGTPESGNRNGAEKSDQKGPCRSQSSDGPRDLDCDSNDLEGELVIFYLSNSIAKKTLSLGIH